MTDTSMTCTIEVMEIKGDQVTKGHKLKISIQRLVTCEEDTSKEISLY